MTNVGNHEMDGKVDFQQHKRVADHVATTSSREWDRRREHTGASLRRFQLSRAEP